MNKITFNQIKAILFDLDGTLWNEQPFKKLALKELFYSIAKKNKITIKKAQEIFEKYILEAERKGIVYNWVTVFKQLGDLSYIDILKKQKKLIRPYPYVKRTLSYLNKKYICAIVTDGARDYTLLKLHFLSLIRYFSLIVTTDDTHSMKPSPRPYFFALNKLKLDPKDCLVVGDQPKDVISGKSAGMFTALIKTRRFKPDIAKPDIIISSIKSLLRIL
ncbi:MAG: HAD family hydrolase [Nitrososphaerales archaeon]